MEIGSGSGSSNKAIPESVMEAVRRTSGNMDEVKANLEEFLSYCTTETLSRMEPLERAQALFLVAKATTTLFALRLRCKGIDPDDHPIKKELERLELYQEKLQRSMDLHKAPLRPSATINPQAAARFIEHSLPDLSAEQKKSMREISRGESSRSKYSDRSLQKKRKYQSSEKQSVRAAAQEFLEKAARELLGDNKNGVKGPLQPEDSDDDVIILD
ncbi:nuclear nucleic acid-binding protein C1D [Sesamum indicum]|uniref:Nuclear nucleic acid-binding protein C1D n=1 Tax=Sesamum indicum TaxID=4182 RepID=A0A6I9TB97_SESIN|nr:nuclear nucleic acid-binding protein C1D [Sesamum indicum]